MTLGKGLESLIPPKKSRQTHSRIFQGKAQSQSRTFQKGMRKQASKNIPIFQKSAASPHNSGDLGELSKKTKTKTIFYIEIDKIKSNPYQPRKDIGKVRLQELADSIKEHGILQPLVVTKVGNDAYQLIAGERRLKASKIAGLSEVPVIIRDSSEQEKVELALIENIQRDNLNPIEKAYAFKKLIDKFDFIQQDIAKRIGKSRETVANTLRLLNLPAEIQRAILANKITEGHGRAILTLSDLEKQILLFGEILKKKLSVRQTEAVAKKIVNSFSKKSKTKNKKEAYLVDLENKISEALGTRVRLTRKGKKGKLIIEFFSQEELNNLVDRIMKRTT